MGIHRKSIVLVATPTPVLLPHLLHAFAHESTLSITLLTRETSISFPFTQAHGHEVNNNHKHASPTSHKTINFHSTSLVEVLQKIGPHILICHLTGSDIHHTSALITAAKSSGVGYFIPSEYGLDTGNTKIRELLPPYQTRYEIQQQLKESDMKWTAIYAGITLEEGLKVDGVLGIDCVWGSVVFYPQKESQMMVLSTFEDIARIIVETAKEEGVVEGNELWTSSSIITFGELVVIIEKNLGKKFDRFDGDIEDSKRETQKGMKSGYFDGGVALMGRVAVWDDGTDSWAGWSNFEPTSQERWEAEAIKLVTKVRDGEVGSSGCGC